jgi:hypothetical protein
MLVVLVVTAVTAAAIVAAAVRRSRRDEARHEALFVHAVTRGWDYTVADDDLAERWIGAPFGEGRDRHATNVIRGTHRHRSFVAFDYEYDTASADGASGSLRRCSVVAVAMPAYLPTLQVVPESVLDRVGDALGADADIDLESEEFNRRFRLSAYDPKFASDVLGARTLERVLKHPSLAFRIQGTDIVSWERGQLDPDDVLARVAILDDVLAGIPDFVWREHGAAAS